MLKTVAPTNFLVYSSEIFAASINNLVKSMFNVNDIQCNLGCCSAQSVKQ